MFPYTTRGDIKSLSTVTVYEATSSEFSCKEMRPHGAVCSLGPSIDIEKEKKGLHLIEGVQDYEDLSQACVKEKVESVN